jgi:hypothetical protein
VRLWWYGSGLAVGVLARELASLVHNESSILAEKAIRDALERGDNLIIDGTLSGEKNARAQFEALEAAGCDVMLADVETTQERGRPPRTASWPAAVPSSAAR